MHCIPALTARKRFRHLSIPTTRTPNIAGIILVTFGLVRRVSFTISQTPVDTTSISRALQYGCRTMKFAMDDFIPSTRALAVINVIFRVGSYGADICIGCLRPRSGAASVQYQHPYACHARNITFIECPASRVDMVDTIWSVFNLRYGHCLTASASRLRALRCSTVCCIVFDRCAVYQCIW